MHLSKVVLQSGVQGPLGVRNMLPDMTYGNLNMQRINKQQRIVNMATKIIGKPQKDLSVMYDEKILNKTKKIINDPCSALRCEFELLPLFSTLIKTSLKAPLSLQTGIRAMSNTGIDT